MNRIIRATAILLTAIMPAAGTAVAQPAPSLNAAGDEALLTLAARGVQVYECRPTAAGVLAWSFKEPRAALFAEGREIGKHFAGPSWELQDGSRLVGKVVASAPASAAGAIPWLRLSVTSTGAAGALSSAKAVQRINTDGGVISGPCAAAGAFSEVPYTADYVVVGGRP